MQTGVQDKQDCRSTGCNSIRRNTECDASCPFPGNRFQVFDRSIPKTWVLSLPKVRELASKDPVPVDAELLVVRSVKRAVEEEEGGVVRPVSGEIAVIRSRLKAIEARMI